MRRTNKTTSMPDAGQRTPALLSVSLGIFAAVTLAIPTVFAADTAPSAERETLRRQILRQEQLSVREKLQAAQERAKRTAEGAHGAEHQAALVDVNRYEADLAALALELAGSQARGEPPPRPSRALLPPPWWDVYATSSEERSKNALPTPASNDAEQTFPPVPLSWPVSGPIPAIPRP